MDDQEFADNLVVVPFFLIPCWIEKFCTKRLKQFTCSLNILHRIRLMKKLNKDLKKEKQFPHTQKDIKSMYNN